MHEAWLERGHGTPPEITWAFNTDAPLISLQWARETGEVVAADASGGIYVLDRSGRVASVMRGPTPLKAIAVSDVGRGGAALVGDNVLYFLTQQLEFQGAFEMLDTAFAVAVEPHGEWYAVSLAGGTNLVFDGPRKPRFHFETDRPLVRIEFLTTDAALIGIADYGLLCSYDFDGTLRWQEKLWQHAGDLAPAPDGSSILIASFSLGIQRFDGQGNVQGSYQVEGAVHRVARSHVEGRIAAATVEGYLYWLDDAGTLLWATTAPEPVVKLICDPLGRGFVCGLESGRLLRLSWPNPTSRGSTR